MEDLLSLLLHSIKIESLFNIIRDHSAIPVSSQAISNSKILTLNDTEVLRTILPEELYELSRQQSLTGTFAFSFALRHSVTYLSMLFHHIADDSIPVPGAFSGRDIEQDIEITTEYLALLNSSREHIIIPVIGFSTVGIHAGYRNKTICRAFDYYDLHYCKNTTSGLFCTNHQKESWWQEVISSASTQAHMFEFHANTENFYAYDEQKLKEETSRFWQAYQEWKKITQPENIQPALEYFAYTNSAEMQKLGQKELRHRYLDLAMKCHPDKGGDKKVFIQLKDYYEILEIHLSG